MNSDNTFVVVALVKVKVVGVVVVVAGDLVEEEEPAAGCEGTRNWGEVKQRHSDILSRENNTVDVTMGW